MARERNDRFDDVLSECLFLMIRPIARYCLRRSMRLQELVEICKIALVRVAEEELAQQGVKVNASRVNLMSGVHRKDVTRILNTHEMPRENSDIVTRIIGEWRFNPRFQTSGGRPKVLSYEGADSDFAKLVSAVSKEFPPFPILFELERSGAVKKGIRGLKLMDQIYSAPPSDLRQGYAMLGTDVADLIECVQYNLDSTSRDPNYHIKTEYDNVSKSAVPQIREWIIQQGSAFHRRLQKFVSKFDCDLNPKLEDGGIRVVVGGFSSIRPVQTDDQD